MPNPYYNGEQIAGPVTTQPQFFWTFPRTILLRWRAWPPSPQPLQMSGGQQVSAPVLGRAGQGAYATTTPWTPEQIPPAVTEGLRAPAQADMLIGGAYPITDY